MTKIDPTKLPVLIVEDEKFMRRLVGHVLGELDYRNVIAAEDRAEGITRLVGARPPVDPKSLFST